jgi:hypothetical protein
VNSRLYFKILLPIAFVATSLLFPAKTLAVSASFDVLPEKNPVAVGETTNVNVFLNTSGNAATLARIVLTYDPDVVQVTDAKYATLFCTYPDDEASFFVDNEEGIVKVTGFCEDDPVQNNTYELFAKITFKGRAAGKTDIKAAFSTAGGVNESAVYDDKSPPQNVLTVEPSKIVFGVGVPSNAPIPGTAIDRSWLFILSIAIFVIGIGAFVFLQTQNKAKLR